MPAAKLAKCLVKPIARHCAQFGVDEFVRQAERFVMHPKIQKAIEYMNANLGRKLLLPELATQAEFSRAHFCEVFKSELGMSVKQYLKTLRIQKAHELLKTTSLSAKEISLAVGIRDQSHFTRDFKRAYGLTPSRYRKQISNSKKR